MIQSITKARIKDCIEEPERLLIIVAETDISKAIGRGGENVKQIERALNRKIKIVEFNPNLISFIKNLVYPLKIIDAVDEDGVVTLTASDVRETRGYAVSEEMRNL